MVNAIFVLSVVKKYRFKRVYFESRQCFFKKITLCQTMSEYLVLFQKSIVVEKICRVMSSNQIISSPLLITTLLHPRIPQTLFLIT